MSDQLKVPSSQPVREPVARSEGAQNTQSSTTPNVADLSRVIKSTERDFLGQKRSDAQLEFNYQSISARTVKLLATNESATEAVKRLLLSSDALRLLQSDSVEGAQLARFLESFFLSPEQLPSYLQSQLSDRSLFQGNFFDFLRQILVKNANNPPVKDSLIALLKGMEMFQNRQSTSAFLLHNLNNLMPYLATSQQKNLLSSMQALQQSLRGGSEPTPDMLRNILQVLRETASIHRDNQPLRNMIMLAVHNLTRLDSSDPSSLTKLFEAFQANLQQYSKFSGEQRELLLHAFQTQLKAASLEHLAADQVLAALDKGLSADSPLSVQLASGHILSSLLLNHSVLLPFLYSFIPLQLDNTYLFSELWAHVDEDEHSNFSGSESDSSGKQVRIFFTLESSVFGYFQGTLEAKDKQLAVELEAPEIAMIPLAGLRDHLGSLVESWGFSLRKLNISPLEKPKKVLDFFGKKVLREAYLNVRV